MSNQIEIAKRIRDLRKSKGYSAKSMANRTGVPFTTYREWENGRRIRNPEYYSKIANIYGVSIEYLLGQQSQVQLPSIMALNQELEKLKKSIEFIEKEIQKLK